MRFLRFLKIAWRLSGDIPWVGEPDWGASDASVLRKFLVLKEGKRFRMILLNMVLKQNQQAVTAKKRLEYEAGFANGVRTTVHTIEALAKDIEESKDFTADIYGVEYLSSKDPTATDNRFSAMIGRG
jgi:hypothetical protein|tara:strand:+ start:3646 stop:4026 length:381 start_codon:yes stop_codon:yes gene_type:complete